MTLVVAADVAVRERQAEPGAAAPAPVAADAGPSRVPRFPRAALARVKISFRSGMIGISLLFVAGGALSAHLPWLWISRANIALLVSQLNDAVIHSTNREVDDLFRSAKNEDAGLLDMLQAGVVDPAQPARLEQAMFAQLRAHREFSLVSFGTPDGDLYFAQRIDEHELSIGRTSWDASRGVATWTEDRYAVSADGVFHTRMMQHEDDINATKRPWYARRRRRPR